MTQITPSDISWIQSVLPLWTPYNSTKGKLRVLDSYVSSTSCLLNSFISSFLFLPWSLMLNFLIITDYHLWRETIFSLMANVAGRLTLWYHTPPTLQDAQRSLSIKSYLQTSPFVIITSQHTTSPSSLQPPKKRQSYDEWLLLVQCFLL